MKITTVEPKYERDPNTKHGYKWVGNETIVLADVPFDVKHIDVYNIKEREFPYTDPALLRAVEFRIAWKMANECEFQYIDHNKTKISFLSDSWDGLYSPQLMVEIFPPDYSTEEREKILSTASREPEFPDSNDEYHREWSWYNHWLEIFDILDNYKHGDDEDYGFYSIIFEPEEEKAFLVFLFEHMRMLERGGHYLTSEEIKEREARLAARKAV